MRFTLRLRHALLAAILMMLPVAAVTAHNVYATFTSIEWNGDDNSVELVMQMHAHELEAHLSLDLGERLTFLNEDDFPKLEAAVGPLLKSKTALELDGKYAEIKYLGMEMQGQTIFIYMETDWPKAPKSIKFMNALFLDELPGQNNSVMAQVKGVRKAGEILSGTGPVLMEF